MFDTLKQSGMWKVLFRAIVIAHWLFGGAPNVNLTGSVCSEWLPGRMCLRFYARPCLAHGAEPGRELWLLTDSWTGSERTGISWLWRHDNRTALATQSGRCKGVIQTWCRVLSARGESLSHASQRIMHFLSNLEKKRHHQTICIVSHGQVIQGLLAILKSGAVDDFHRFGQPNASYSVFHLNNGICDTLRWGIATHLRLLE